MIILTRDFQEQAEGLRPCFLSTVLGPCRRIFAQPSDVWLTDTAGGWDINSPNIQ